MLKSDRPFSELWWNVFGRGGGGIVSLGGVRRVE